MPEITITYRNIGDKPIKMIDASVWFWDVLGKNIGGVELNRDIKIAVGAEGIEKFRVPSAGFERLTNLDALDVEGLICTEAALFDDGTKQQF